MRRCFGMPKRVAAPAASTTAATGDPSRDSVISARFSPVYRVARRNERWRALAPDAEVGRQNRDFQALVYTWSRVRVHRAQADLAPRGRKEVVPVLRASKPEVECRPRVHLGRAPGEVLPDAPRAAASGVLGG